ncbi:MAG: porin [Parvibaculum sp.]|jgi:phosphate-selective porin OprO/OprP|uniref:OprO/OprP family phosphate-selective porin n=1 Tax=Parvibaculum sp. TaxID=2024848 RepID=UPI0028443290|nr:porin [Parvibaculum sp.]MDR3500816.1 porin [Parvibaculum sp.]
MTLRTVLLAGTALGAAALLAGPAFAGSAATTQNEIDTMKQQIQELQQKLDDMQISQGNEIKDIKEKQDAVQVSLDNGAPSFKSGDGLFTMAIKGRMHLDMASADSSSGITRYNSGANFRRAEIGVEGTFMKDWGYVFGLQFGGSGVENGGTGLSSSQFIKNAYITYNGFGKTFIPKIGAGELPYTLEYATSSNDITFIERAAAVNENISMGSDDGRVFVGAQGSTSNLFYGAWYTRSKTGETGTNNSERDNAVGRFVYAFQPDDKSNIHLGVSSTYTFNAGSAMSLSDRPGIRVSDVKYINTGSFTNLKDAYVFGPEFAASYGPVKVQGEYYHFDFQNAKQTNFAALRDYSFNSWYAQASWVLTGEAYKYSMAKAAYGGVKPASPFSLGGSPGAWEVALRYSDSNLNDGAFKGGHEKLYTAGLNWYVNNNIRFMLNYIYGDEEQPNGTNTATSAGKFKAVALRTQLAF